MLRGNPDTGAESSDSNSLEEWKVARSKISELDNNLHDLRKYGLTFTAALLATNSILDYSKLNILTKFSISIITISFITVISLVDQYYQGLIEVISNRARVLETAILNIELDETISNRFKKDNLPEYIKWTYIGLIFIGVAVGVAVIVSFPNTPSTNVGNMSFLSSTSIRFSDRSNISFILKLVALYVLLLIPLVILKNVDIYTKLLEDIKKHAKDMKNKDSRSKLWSDIKKYLKNESSRPKLWNNLKKLMKSFKPFILLPMIFIIALYYALILFCFYFTLMHLFSLEITLSLLLIFIGCIGTYITEISSKIIARRRYKQEDFSKLEIVNGCDKERTSKKIRIDWTIDRLSCKQGEVVRITATNLGKNCV